MIIMQMILILVMVMALLNEMGIIVNLILILYSFLSFLSYILFINFYFYVQSNGAHHLTPPVTPPPSTSNLSSFHHLPFSPLVSSWDDGEIQRTVTFPIFMAPGKSTTCSVSLYRGTCSPCAHTDPSFV